MKFTLPFFVTATLWTSVHGQQESASLRGGGAIVDAATIDVDESAPTDLIQKVDNGDEGEDVQRRLGLTDWTQCSTSSQCNNGCCSGKYSGGVNKCTPLSGGFRADICIVAPAPTPTPPSGTGTLGDWTQCTASSQCQNGCCSGTYSGGVNKCTPVGGFRSDICIVGGGGPTPTPPTTTTGNLGDWEQCSASSQCRNGCCSGTYSGGVNKCTPVGGFRSDICIVGGGGGGGGGGGVVPTPTPPTGGGTTLLSGSGSGTYYYDITNRMCPGIDTSSLNNAYPKCTSNDPAFYKTLGQYGNNNIIAIDNNLLSAPGGRERYCGKQVRVYRNGAEVPGPFVIMDGCPTCGSTKLDFSLTALDRISGGNACQGGNIGGLSWTVTSNQIIPFVP